MGPTHRLFGALAGAGVATAAGQPWAMVAMTSLVATATSHGWSSPDLDQTEPWQKLGRWSGPLGQLFAHRHLTHWWGLAVLAWVGAGHLPADSRWPAVALLAGWVSHLVGDAIFGKIPLLPWGGYFVGLGLDTGGFIETGRARIRNRERTVLPFGPTRLLIAAALVLVLAAPAMPTIRPYLAALGG